MRGRRRRQRPQPDRCQAESAINTIDGQLQEHGDKISAADKQNIEAASAALKASLESNDTAEIASKTQALVQASMKIGEALYGGQGQGGAAPGGDNAGGPDQEGVVDADFEEVDGNSKKSA